MPASVSPAPLRGSPSANTPAPRGFLASRRQGHCSRLRFLGSNTAKDMVEAGSKTERPREAWLPPPQPRGLSQSQLCLQMPLRTVPGTQASRVMPCQGQSLDTMVARIWCKSARLAQEKCRGAAGSSAPLPRLWGSVRRVAGGTRSPLLLPGPCAPPSGPAYPHHAWGGCRARAPQAPATSRVHRGTQRQMHIHGLRTGVHGAPPGLPT